MRRPLLHLLGVLAFVLAATPSFAAPAERPKTHVVYPGQRLGSIAKRYNVSIEALCSANGIRERDAIRPGQRLIVPDRSDKDGSAARALRLASAGGRDPTSDRARPDARTGKVGPAWTQYRKTPRRKGYVEIVTHTTKWRGLVIDSKDKIRAPARKALAALLEATGSRPKVPDGLIRLMVRVSDTFGGRPLRVVSGYRTTSYFRDSRHKTSEAVDFSVTGVPNAAVRDYLLTLGKVGVGYYPNSTFLHLDVRPRRTLWVDYAGPGEAPRRRLAERRAPTPMDLDDHAEEVAESDPAALRPEADPRDGANPAPSAAQVEAIGSGAAATPGSLPESSRTP